MKLKRLNLREVWEAYKIVEPHIEKNQSIDDLIMELLSKEKLKQLVGLLYKDMPDYVSDSLLVSFALSAIEQTSFMGFVAFVSEISNG